MVSSTTDIDIRPWSDGDFPVLERTMGDPAMTVHLGGPESPEKLRERHERYCRIDNSGKGRMFVIVVGPERLAADFEYPPGSGNFMRCNDWRLDLFANESEGRSA